ncbi:ribonuclease H-like domain-containing protein, partial [Mycena rosella]
NISIRLPKGDQTNQRAELFAIMTALINNRKDNLIIKTDSRTSIDGILGRLKEWEDKDWIEIKNSKEWKKIAYELRSRSATTSFQWIKAHNGEIGNEEADKLADEGNYKAQETTNYEIPKEWEVEGARLSKITQKTAYKLALREKKKTPGGLGNTRTKRNIERAKESIESVNEARPTTETIWKGLKNPIHNKIIDYIWKLIHVRTSCGSFFKNIPQWEDKQYCKEPCGKIEEPEHILLQCIESGVPEFWEHIGTKWTEATNRIWETPDFGTIMGLGAIQFKKSEGKPDSGATELYKILVSEGIWVVWKAR